jgi:hypothetical protein
MDLGKERVAGLQVEKTSVTEWCAPPGPGGLRTSETRVFRTMSQSLVEPPRGMMEAPNSRAFESVSTEVPRGGLGSGRSGSCAILSRAIRTDVGHGRLLAGG